jgi:predicted flap endonuclease-1-like 5' DNA nuclease
MGWLILILFVIVVLIVWIALTRNAKQSKPDFEVGAHSPGEAHASEGQEVLDTPPASKLVEAPAEAAPEPAAALKPDDLKIVEGIGPKVSTILNEAGITTFAQLGEASEGRLREILEKAGLPFIDPASWPEQARLAAAGKMGELQALQTELKAGRRG